MANSDYVIYLLVLIVCIDLLSFLGQAAITDINPDKVAFYTCEGGVLQSGSENGTCVSQSQDPRENLPDATSPLVPTTENIFTDMFSSIKSFFVEKTGLGDIFLILIGPVRYLIPLGLPLAFTFALGAAWLVISFFVLISFFWGR